MKGMTLIETLLYISLFSVLMTGLLLSSSDLISITQRQHSEAIYVDSEVLNKKFHE